MLFLQSPSLGKMFLYTMPEMRLYQAKADLPPFRYSGDTIQPSPFLADTHHLDKEALQPDEERVVRSADTNKLDRKYYQDWIMQNLG